MRTGQDRVLSRQEAAEYLGFRPATLARWAWRKTGPRFHVVGRRARHAPEDLNAFVEDGERHPSGGAGPRERSK